MARAAAVAALTSPAAGAARAVAPSPPLTPGVARLTHDTPRAEPAAPRVEPAPAANDTFVPYPSPLRDLAGEGARKTLVGITPPTLLQSIASAVNGKAASDASPQTGLSSRSATPAAHGAAAPRAAAPTRSTIEGAPCKPIETNEEPAGFDLGAFDASRRPAHPTVPFPRPRPVPRTATLPNISDETPDIGRASWHGTTTRTLRFVLTSPDHKPQRVAAALVCAVAALVIFAAGRSPLAGTAGIGQATGSLSADPSPKPASPLPPPTDVREIEKASGSDPNPEGVAPGELSAPKGLADEAPRPRDPEVPPLELAPGLVMPPESAGPTRPASDVSAPLEGETPRPAPSAPKPVPKRATPPAPAPSSSPPDRKNSTELDFGI